MSKKFSSEPKNIQDDSFDIKCPECGITISIPTIPPIRPIKPGCEDIYLTLDLTISALEMRSHVREIQLKNILKQLKKILEVKHEKC